MQSANLVRKEEQDASAALKERATATPVASGASVSGPRIHDFERLSKKNGWTEERMRTRFLLVISENLSSDIIYYCRVRIMARHKKIEKRDWKTKVGEAQRFKLVPA